MLVRLIGTGGLRQSSSTSITCQPKMIIDRFGFSLLSLKPQNLLEPAVSVKNLCTSNSITES